jgi:hypothetical protein
MVLADRNTFSGRLPASRVRRNHQTREERRQCTSSSQRPFDRAYAGWHRHHAAVSHRREEPPWFRQGCLAPAKPSSRSRCGKATCSWARSEEPAELASRRPWPASDRACAFEASSPCGGVASARAALVSTGGAPGASEAIVSVAARVADAPRWAAGGPGGIGGNGIGWAAAGCEYIAASFANSEGGFSGGASVLTLAGTTAALSGGLPSERRSIFGSASTKSRDGAGAGAFNKPGAGVVSGTATALTGCGFTAASFAPPEC